jgi:hypothetical protein
MATAAIAQSQPASDAFHWIDFHDSKDTPTVTWVTNALKAEHWTAIREIGVQWDSALVITTERKTAQSTPKSDLYTVWSVSLAKRDVQPVLHGVNLDILTWTTFGGPYQHVPELGLIYDDCTGCDAPTTSFTTLFYNTTDHAWRARWMRGDQAAVLMNRGAVEGVTRSQLYGLHTEPQGRQILATWSHFDYGDTKPAEDFVFEYSVDPVSGLEQTQGLSGKHAEAMMARICHADPGQADPMLGALAHGQDSSLCRNPGQLPSRPSRHSRSGHNPATSPPANNHGLSSPGGKARQPVTSTPPAAKP